MSGYYRCTECGSTHVRGLIEVELNSTIEMNPSHYDPQDCYCDRCDAKFKSPKWWEKEVDRKFRVNDAINQLKQLKDNG